MKADSERVLVLDASSLTVAELCVDKKVFCRYGST